MVCQICTSLKKREEHQHDQLIVIVIVVIGFPKVELESSRMYKTRRRQSVSEPMLPPWRLCHQTRSISDFILFHLPFPVERPTKQPEKPCCFLCWAQSDCHKCSLVFMFPEKSRWKTNSLRRRVEVFDSTTDPHWHVVIHEWVSGDMTWDHLKVGILKFRVINVSKDIDLTFRNLEKGCYEIHSYESRRENFLARSAVSWSFAKITNAVILPSPLATSVVYQLIQPNAVDKLAFYGILMEKLSLHCLLKELRNCY